MSFVHVDDVLADRETCETMDPALVALLAALAKRAAAEGQPALGTLETFDVTVSPRGEIEVDTAPAGAFAEWVWAAGDLALMVGPRSGDVNGVTRTVEEILGSEDERDAGTGPPAATPPIVEIPEPAGLGGPFGLGLGSGPLDTSPHWAPWSARTPLPEVDVAAPLSVWLCPVCGALSDDPADFEAAASGGTAPSCPECSVPVNPRAAVRRPGGVTLLPPA